MKNKNILLSVLMLCLIFPFFARAPKKQINPEAKSFVFSETVEKERPELDEETKTLVASYRKNPTAKNMSALRKKIGENYDAVDSRRTEYRTEAMEESRKTSGRYGNVGFRLVRED